MRSFVKIKFSRNDDITLSTTDIGKSYHSRKFLWSQVCLLTLFAKISFSRKFPDLQFMIVVFLDHTHLLFFTVYSTSNANQDKLSNQYNPFFSKIVEETRNSTKHHIRKTGKTRQ